MIQEAKTRRTLSWGGAAAIVTLAGLLLPVALVSAQSAQPEAAGIAPGGPAAPADGSPQPDSYGLSPAAKAAKPVVGRTVERATNSLTFERRLDEARAEVRALSAQLLAAQKRLDFLVADARARQEPVQSHGTMDATLDIHRPRGSTNDVVRRSAPITSGGFDTLGEADLGGDASAMVPPRLQTTPGQVSASEIVKVLRDLQAEVTQLKREVQAMRKAGR